MIPSEAPFNPLHLSLGNSLGKEKPNPFSYAEINFKK